MQEEDNYAVGILLNWTELAAVDQQTLLNVGVHEVVKTVEECFREEQLNPGASRDPYMMRESLILAHVRLGSPTLLEGYDGLFFNMVLVTGSASYINFFRLKRLAYEAGTGDDLVDELKMQLLRALFAFAGICSCVAMQTNSVTSCADLTQRVLGAYVMKILVQEDETRAVFCQYEYLGVLMEFSKNYWAVHEACAQSSATPLEE